MHPNEYTARIGRFARWQLDVLLVVWLAVFAPVYCQYHGLLLAPPDPHAHHAHHNAEPASYHSPSPSLSSGAPAAGYARGHMRASDAAQVMSLFLVALPVGVRVQPPASEYAALPSLRIAVTQRPLPPPDQPPRSAMI